MGLISNLVCAFLVVAGWVCGCFAQGQMETGGGFTQDMVPRDSKTCGEVRYNLELMLYNTYKGSIPRMMLKEVLPGLVEPLMPAACVGSGSHVKWLQETAVASPDQASRLKRQVGQFFMPPMNIKDPGDHPPPGMMRNPMKDPGDRPAGMMTMPMAGIFGLGRQWGRPSPAMDMFSKPFRGRYYGDQLPHGRRKRSAVMAEEEEEDSEVDVPHLRKKRANGEEEKKGFNFNPFGFFFDRPDHRKSSSPSFMFPMSFFDSLFNMGQRRQTASFRRNGNRGGNGGNGGRSYGQRNQFGPRPNTFFGDAPGWTGSSSLRQAPVRGPAQFFPQFQSQAPAPLAQPMQSPTAPMAPRSPMIGSPARSTSQGGFNMILPSVRSSGLQALMGPSRGPSAIPAMSPLQSPPLSPSPSLPAASAPAAFVAPAPALSPSPALSPAPAAFAAPSPTIPTGPAIAPAPSPPMFQASAPQPPPTASQGGFFGDRLPSYGVSSTTSRRRVKRASDNGDKSSSSDVVTFGDFSMPADTFKKLVNPRDSRSDDVVYNDRRAYYSRPPVRGPMYNPYGPAPPMYNYNPPMYNRNYLARRTMAQKRYGRMYQPSRFSRMPNNQATQTALLNRRRAAMYNQRRASLLNRQPPTLLNSQAAQQQAAMMNPQQMGMPNTPMAMANNPMAMANYPMSMAASPMAMTNNAISPLPNPAGLAGQAGMAPLPMGAAMPPVFGNFPAF